MLKADQGDALLELARAAVMAHLHHSPAPELPIWASEPAATFVTLKKRGQLRGCIGSLEAKRPLGDDIAHNAIAAACLDPRFPPLTWAEWPDIRFEISILSSAEPLSCGNEFELLQRLRPGVDGLILESGRSRATFLPQVWEQLSEPRQFVHQLKLKAGLPVDWWDTQAQWSCYQAQKFVERT